MQVEVVNVTLGKLLVCPACERVLPPDDVEDLAVECRHCRSAHAIDACKREVGA